MSLIKLRKVATEFLLHINIIIKVFNDINIVFIYDTFLLYFTP